MTLPPTHYLTRTVPDYLIPERSGVSVWLSNAKRDGEWTLPRIFRTFALMGEVKLDLTSAQMGPGESEIEIICVLASVEIKVPPDVRVICDGDGVAGEFEVKRTGDIPPLEPDAPTLKVSGNAYLGSVTIRIEGYPGPGWKERIKAGWDFFYS